MADVITGRVAVGTMARIAGGRVGTIGRIGSIGRVGSMGYVARVGSVNYIVRMGSVGRIGSQPYVGSVNRLGGGRVGSLGYLGSVRYVGSVNRFGGGRIGSAANLTGSIYIQGQKFAGTVMRQNIGLGPGSTWVGSWQYIADWRNKTFAVRSLGGTNGGSLSLIAGLTGTTQTRLTGTYYGPARIGAGSFVTTSFTEHFQYIRPIVRMSGQRRGTLYVGLSRSAL